MHASCSADDARRWRRIDASGEQGYRKILSRPVDPLSGHLIIARFFSLMEDLRHPTQKESKSVASPSASTLSISAFPSDDWCWRVEWFGQTGFPNPRGRYRQASVCVSISRVRFLSKTRYMTEPPISRWVSVGTLVLLRVGDLYRGRRKHSSGDGEVEIFRDICVDPPGTEIVKTGRSEAGDFLLPLAFHPGHRDHTRGYCVRIPLSDGRQLIVPCMEIIRFYFGSSSTLLSKLFRPDLKREDLFDPTQSWVRPDRARAHLHLTDGLPGRSAVDVARIAGDKAAWHSAIQIGLSMASDHNQGYIRTSFPFTGRTTLLARGKWLPLGNQPGRTFVVHQLLSCSHPLPFQSLSYRAEWSSRPTSRERSTRTSSDSPESKKAAVVSTQSLLEQDPGRLAVATFSFTESKRFPDLIPKLVYRKLTDTRKDPQHTPVSSSPGPIIGLALGEPGSSDRIRPVEFEAEPFMSPPNFLERVVEFLSCVADLTFRQLTNSGDDGWTLPLEALIDGMPQSLRWITPAEDPSSRQRRRVAILRVDQDWGGRVWVIVEGNGESESLLCSYPADDSSDDAELERFRRRFGEGLQATADAVDVDARTLDHSQRAPAPSETIRAVLELLWD